MFGSGFLGIARHRFGALLLLTITIGTGCSTASKEAPPLQPPPLSPIISYRLGGLIPSPTTRPVEAIAAGDALALRATWLALSRAPRTFRPILADATLIASPRSADPFLAAGQMSRDAQIVSGAEVEAFLADVGRGKYGQHAAIATRDAALPRGVTATLGVADAVARIEVDLHRSAATATTEPTTAPATAAATPDETLSLSLTLDDADGQRERVLLSPGLAPSTRVAFILPSRFPAPRVKAIVAIIEVEPPSDSQEHREAVAQCAEQLRRLAAGSGPAVAPNAGTAPGGWAGLSAALRAANQPRTARVAMVYLAGESGTELFGDVALVAPEEMLAELAGRLRERLGDPPAAMPATQLGWQLDVVTLEHLAALQASEKMLPELNGVLARFAGEAARNAGSLEELTRVRGREQLRTRLISENFTYLEDASPSARVRAYEWLRSRGRAPAKYDPLGPAKERAAAIDAATTAAAAVPVPQTVPSPRGVP